MAATRTLTAVDPATGARITRRTARTYVGVIVTGDPAQGQAWAQSWAGRPDLAAKQLAKWGPDSHARLAPVVSDPWATPEPAARPTLPGELTPPPAPAPHGAAAPELPALPPVAPPAPAPACLAQIMGPHSPATLRAARAARAAQALEAAAPPAGAGVAAHRAAAAAGRPVSLAALAHDMGRSLGLAQGGRLPSRRPATGEGLAGMPWDPGTPEARAQVALQGERVGILWPIAQALRGEGVALPPSWATDGPVMGGGLTLSDALARLPLGAIAQAAAALAALPPVTAAQDAALALCLTGAVPGRPYL